MYSIYINSKVYANIQGEFTLLNIFVIIVSHSYTNVINCLNISVRKNPSQTELTSPDRIIWMMSGGVQASLLQPEKQRATPFGSIQITKQRRRQQVLINQIFFSLNNLILIFSSSFFLLIIDNY